MSAAWLLGGDAKVRAVSRGGGRYDLPAFKKFRAGLRDGMVTKTGVELTLEVTRMLEEYGLRR